MYIKPIYIYTYISDFKSGEPESPSQSNLQSMTRRLRLRGPLYYYNCRILLVRRHFTINDETITATGISLYGVFYDLQNIHLQCCRSQGTATGAIISLIGMPVFSISPQKVHHNFGCSIYDQVGGTPTLAPPNPAYRGNPIYFCREFLENVFLATSPFLKWLRRCRLLDALHTCAVVCCIGVG